MPQPVTDPELLAQLNGGGPKPVNDPALLKQLSGANMSTGDHVADFAKSVPTGVAEGVIGLADLPEYGARGLDKAVNFVGNQLGYGNVPRPGTTSTFDQRFTGAGPDRQTIAGYQLPSAADIQGKVEQATGPFHQPQGAAGEWGKTLGGFAPGIIGGPGGLGMRAITQVAAPMLASEGAGHIAKGTAYEAPAKIVGALVGGPAASRAVMGKAAHSAEQLKASGVRVFDDPAINAIPVDTSGLAQRMVAAMEKKGADQLNTATPYKRVEYVENLQNPTVGSVRDVTKKLNADARSTIATNPTSTGASDAARHELNDFLGGYSPKIKEANANYAAGKRSDTVMGKLEDAEYGAAATHSGKNAGNKTRQLMESIRKNDRLTRGMNDAEIAQLEKIIKGTTIGNRARDLGNRLGGGGGVGQAALALGLGGGGYAVGGNEGAAAGLALTGIGAGARGLSNMSTARQARILDQMIRARSPLAQAGSPASIDIAAFARALLQASAANQSSRTSH